jgi:pentose-5-phosphate-3-epimerase
MYIISQVHIRRTSPVRNYLRLHGAYVSIILNPNALCFHFHIMITSPYKFIQHCLQPKTHCFHKDERSSYHSTTNLHSG